MEPQYTGDKIIECPKSFSKSQPKRLPACGSCKQLEKAVARARATVRTNSGRLRAPLRTGGFWTVAQRADDELKFLDTVQAASAVGTAGGNVLINGIIQGDDFNMREGRKVTWTSLLFRGTIFATDAANLPTGDVVRVMVVWDNQPNAALAAVTDVLATASYESAMNLNNRDRFMVISDKFYTVEATHYTAGALDGGSPCPVFFNVFKKFNLNTIFGGTTAAVGSISTGTMFVLAISKAANISQLSFNSRLRFIDP